MEYWNLYNYLGKKKKKIAIRGSKLNNDDYHLVVNAWIMNNKGEFLITQRSANKSHPLMWECTGGSALLNETSQEAAIREVKEELGIDVSKSKAELVGSTRRFYELCPDILDVWLFKKNISIEKITIQEEEVNDVMWASREKIIELFKQGKFEPNTFFEKVLYPNQNIYYLGFNANNAICNTSFFKGMITLNPNHEKGNIYYTKEFIKEKDDIFLDKYKKYLVSTMKELSKSNKNCLFIAFNNKIKDLLIDEKKYNIITVDNKIKYDLNDKKETRKQLEKKIPVLKTSWIDKKISYKEAQKISKSEIFVIQGKEGAGGNNTYYIDSKEKFEKYSLKCNNKYLISKYIKHLPINITVIIGKYNDIIFPVSIQLIKLTDDNFKYVGADFIYYQTLNNNIKEKVESYTKIIIKTLKENGYKGIIGIDYIIDDNDNVLFMEFNPRFQSSSFILSQHLEKYCSTSIAELHYLATQDKYIGNIFIDRIDKSFVNCYDEKEFTEFKYGKIIKYGYYKKNKTSCFRRIFDYSILKHGNFEKRDND